MVNTKYKDRLFCLLFGDERYKENILSLYNALCNTEYENADDLQIYTIDDVIYIKMKNDVSILLDSCLSLWEQQSTFNPNMPVRGLMYFGKMYSRYITENKLNIYGKKLIRIPTPRYTVFYNGTEDYPSVMKLKLSDAFMKTDPDGGFEWTAHLINLNEGKNDQLLDQCKTLKEYMILINMIRRNSKQMKFEEAVNASVDYCIENDILKKFLVKHKSEVLDMCITEFNEKVFIDGIREEGLEEGLEKGREEGLEKGLEKGREEGRNEKARKIAVNMYNGGITIDRIAEFAQVSMDTVKQWLADASATTK